MSTLIIKEKRMTMKARPPFKSTGKGIKTQIKTRTTVCLPDAMLKQIHRVMDQEAFSRKRRSQWIEKTIIHLFQQDEFDALILEEFLEPGSNITIPLSLEENMRKKIDRAIEGINRKAHYPIERSAVIRTAISQYLVRHSGKNGNE